jgi:hypothetical protein
MNIPDASQGFTGTKIGMRVRKSLRDETYAAGSLPNSVLHPVQFGKLYHGSDREFSPGDSITSPNSRGVDPSHVPSPHTEMQLVNGGERLRTGDETYAAYSPRMAHQYSRQGAGHVYEVEHTGDLSPDPENPVDQVYSTRPMRVKRKLTSDEIR